MKKEAKKNLKKAMNMLEWISQYPVEEDPETPGAHLEDLVFAAAIMAGHSAKDLAVVMEAVGKFQAAACDSFFCHSRGI